LEKFAHIDQIRRSLLSKSTQNLFLTPI